MQIEGVLFTTVTIQLEALSICPPLYTAAPEDGNLERLASKADTLEPQTLCIIRQPGPP